MMFALLPSDGVPENAIVVVGMDWGEHSDPSKADLQAIWPEHHVTTFPVDKVPVSNAIVMVTRFTTVQALMSPLYKYGVKRAVMYRAEHPPPSAGEDLGRRLLSDLERARDFVFGPFTGGDDDGGFFGSAKTVAVTVCVVAGLAGLGLIIFHYAGK